MHLGNVYAALMSYRSAKSRGGKWLLRIEDIDPERSHRDYAYQLMDDLDWLGLHWDGEPVWQSERTEIYEQQLRRVADLGLVYPCHCTRAEIMATQAPHETDGHIVYSGKCRPIQPRYDLPLGETLRLRVPDDGEETFVDDLCGPQRVKLSAHCGDFIVRRRDGAWAYQWAVAIDDALMGVTEVVRGDDLLLSTAVQRYVQRLLGLPLPTRYAHIPLLRDEQGRRLSKRDQSLSMEYLRQHCTPEEVIEKLDNMD